MPGGRWVPGEAPQHLDVLRAWSSARAPGEATGFVSFLTKVSDATQEAGGAQFQKSSLHWSLMSQHCSAKETETKYSRWFETVSGIPEGYEISSFIADDKSEDIGHFAQLITLTGLPETDSWKSISFIIEKHQNKRPRRRCRQQWGEPPPAHRSSRSRPSPRLRESGASAGRAALQVPLLAWSLIKWILKCRI